MIQMGGRGTNQYQKKAPQRRNIDLVTVDLHSLLRDVREAREAAIKDLQCPARVLERIFADLGADVEMPDFDKDDVESTPDFSLRLAILAHPNCPPNIIKLVCTGPIYLGRTVDLSADGDLQLYPYILKVIETVAHRPDPDIQSLASIIQNPPPDYFGIDPNDLMSVLPQRVQAMIALSQ